MEESAPPEISSVNLPDFPAMVEFLREKESPFLSSYLSEISVVEYSESSRILYYQPNDILPANFATTVAGALKKWTGHGWEVRISTEQGTQSLADQKADAWQARCQKAQEHPEVQAFLKRFEGIRIVDFFEIISDNDSTNNG